MNASGLLAESSPGDAGRSYMLIAEVFDDLGESARARELYELAVDVMPATDRYRADVYSRLAVLLEREGHKDEALELLKRAMRLQSGSQSRR